MSNIDAALAESRAAMEELLIAAERSRGWTTPRAAGKWSPSQIVEHVARAYEESAHAAMGQPTKFPTFPGFVWPLVRMVFFDRAVRSGKFPRGKTNKAMDPLAGSATPAEARLRLEAAHAAFDLACRACGGRFDHSIFGAVSAIDYARFQAMHTRHHARQMPLA